MIFSPGHFPYYKQLKIHNILQINHFLINLMNYYTYKKYHQSISLLSGVFFWHRNEWSARAGGVVTVVKCF